MKAVILAGGPGTRLLPLTCNIPKPMVPVLNRPFLDYMLTNLKNHKIDDAIMTMCYLPDKIQEYFGGGSVAWPRLTYVLENEPLGTAGAVKNAEDYLKDTFLVCNGDILTDLDLQGLISFHRSKNAKVTIALTRVEDPSSFGVVEVDSLGKIASFTEKPSKNEAKSSWVNAGTYILEPDVLEFLPNATSSMFETELFPKLLKLGCPIYGFCSESYWLDMGTPSGYLSLNRDLMPERKPVFSQEIWQGKLPTEPVTLDGSTIHRSVKFEGSVFMGKRCKVSEDVLLKGFVVLGEGCVIGPGSVIENCVLWNNVILGDMCSLDGSVVATRANLGMGVNIREGCMVGEGVRLEDGYKLKNGQSIFPAKSSLPAEG